MVERIANMVRPNRIYTGTGDTGSTRLGDGTEVTKTHPRVEAYGAVDEANAAIGIVVAAIGTDADSALTESHRGALVEIQNDLFDVGADLARPIAPDEPSGEALRIVRAQSTHLEQLIDEYNDDLAPLASFVLPGGTILAAQLHLARTVVRRAERRVASLLNHEPEATNSEVLVYLNRLSDLLFVLARVANAPTSGDVNWVRARSHPSTDDPESDRGPSRTD